jgi:hypothetical protein
MTNAIAGKRPEHLSYAGLASNPSILLSSRTGVLLSSQSAHGADPKQNVQKTSNSAQFPFPIFAGLRGLLRKEFVAFPILGPDS